MTTTRTTAKALEEVLARAFHDRYEELAPSFGYETREDTRQFDPKSPNGRLMIRVIADLLPRLRAALATPQAGEVEECIRLLQAYLPVRTLGEEAQHGGLPETLRMAIRLLRATQSNVAERAKGVEPTSASSIPEARTPGESPAPSAPAAAMPEIIVSGPVACGKSYVMELIYKALRDAGLHPYSDELAHERRMVDEQPLPPAKVWKLRESIAAPQPDEAVALLREVVRRYDDYRGKGMLPAPGEYQMVVGAIERIRAFLKDRT